ncbi:ABC transporter ATP-binding protein [Halomonas sp. GXIMD04776]|uniref:ABC transporter ATP-binding protein n=1 Tax=Halomonas sp. GXIMD04776 TaxID=3415605 RepID=UPI003CAC1A0B
MLDINQLSHGFAAKPLWMIDRLQWSGRDMVHLLGDNGSGKTTLLRILAGLETPRQGTVHWRLDRQWQLPPCPGRVIYLHQTPYMFDTSVSENLRLAARWHGLGRRDTQAHVRRMLIWCGLERQGHQSARSLSGGERLRLALARAWSMQPDVLLLDEPTANLDAQAIADVDTLVADLARAGCAVIMSAHHSSVLTERCQRLWQLRDGTLQESAPNAFFEAERILR